MHAIRIQRIRRAPMKKIISLLITLLLAACAPQAELVKTRSDMDGLRDDVKTTKARVQEVQKRLDQDLQSLQKRLDSIDANVKGTVDAQKVMADYGARSDQLAMDIQLMQGKLEENNFRIAELAQKLDDRSVKIAELSARIEEFETKIKLLSAGTSTATSGQTTTAAADRDKQPAAKMIEPSEAYRQAKSDYDKGNFDLALAGFQNYLAQFPSASQADNAQYWAGECYYSLKDWSKAIEAFTKVIKNHPRSDKAPGAKLKIGLAYLNEKNPARAKEYLRRVVKEHPGTNEAEIAKDRLARIK
jgi:tol-pal system protein YbgF